MGHKKAQKAQKRIPSDRTTKRSARPTRNSSATGRKASATRSNRSRKGAKTQTTAKEITPTIGDLDLHFFGEGKHLRIYDKLGAHSITHESKRGVAFAVWAPAADRLSVVGNFNSWDATRNPMRCLSSSGVWETFIPRLKLGELYKYAISTADPEFL